MQALAFVLATGTRASAEVPRLVQLDYERQDGAVDCPDAAGIQAGVTARLGYDPFRDQAENHLRATVRQAAHALEARIEMTDAHGNLLAERRLFSRQGDCAELASSVELAISIAIDPLGSPKVAPSSTTDSSPAGDRSPTPPAEVAGSSSEMVDRSTPPPPISESIEVAVLGGLGSAPSANVGFMAGMAARRRDLSLGVEGRVDLPASASLRVGESSASLLVGSVVPCLHVGMVAACALATAGALHGAGHGLVNSRTVTVPYLGFGVRLAAAIPVTARLCITAHGDVTAPVTKTALTVDGSEVWSTPAVALALGLGIAAIFP